MKQQLRARLKTRMFSSMSLNFPGKAPQNVDFLTAARQDALSCKTEILQAAPILFILYRIKDIIRYLLRMYTIVKHC
jgi:hypothetical protein